MNVTHFANINELAVRRSVAVGYNSEIDLLKLVLTERVAILNDTLKYSPEDESLKACIVTTQTAMQGDMSRVRKPEKATYYSYEDKEYKTVVPNFFYSMMHTIGGGMMIVRFPNPVPAWRRLVMPAITRLANSRGYTRKKFLSSMYGEVFFETRIDETFAGTYLGFKEFYLVVWEDNELKIIRDPITV